MDDAPSGHCGDTAYPLRAYCPGREYILSLFLSGLNLPNPCIIVTPRLQRIRLFDYCLRPLKIHMRCLPHATHGVGHRPFLTPEAPLIQSIHVQYIQMYGTSRALCIFFSGSETATRIPKSNIVAHAYLYHIKNHPPLKCIGRCIAKARWCFIPPPLR